jgi:hypothetical protein
MSITKINITQPLIFEFLRENNVTLNFPVTTDYTTKKLKFVIKINKDQTTPEVVVKKNALNGGSDAQILVTPTNIAVSILYNDTPSLATGKWYCSINDVDDAVEIVNGIIILQSPVQSVYAPGYIPSGILGPQKIFSIISNVLIPEIDNGYNSNLSLIVTAPGVYQLNSDIPMFTNQDIVIITPILETDTDVYFYKYNMISTTQLQISVYAFFAGGNVNKDIRISINRITS